MARHAQSAQTAELIDGVVLQLIAPCCLLRLLQLQTIGLLPYLHLCTFQTNS